MESAARGKHQKQGNVKFPYTLCSWQHIEYFDDPTSEGVFLVNKSSRGQTSAQLFSGHNLK